MRHELSRRAQADLDDIRDYSVEQFGVERAILYLDEIEQAFRRLIDHPQIGSGRADLGKALLSYPAGSIAFSMRCVRTRFTSSACCIRRWMWSGGFRSGDTITYCSPSN